MVAFSVPCFFFRCLTAMACCARSMGVVFGIGELCQAANIRNLSLGLLVLYQSVSRDDMIRWEAHSGAKKVTCVAPL
jgi:hypothetical protein